MEASDLPLDLLDITPYPRLKGTCQMVPLHKCCKCPFSVCAECDSCGQQESFGTHLQAESSSKFFNQINGKCKNYCRNCDSENPHQKLLRVLEASWGQMCSTKLAIPFFRPFLPLCNEMTRDSEEHLDLLGIVEKIRRWQYTTIEQYRNDLKGLRTQITARLTLVGALHFDERSGWQGTGKMLYDALQSILESAHSVLEQHTSDLTILECRMNDSVEHNGAGQNEQDTQARQYWRKECEREVLGRGVTCTVPARTLEAWNSFVSAPSVTVCRTSECNRRSLATELYPEHAEQSLMMDSIQHTERLEDVKVREVAAIKA
jgi:hypothetical protein